MVDLKGVLICVPLYTTGILLLGSTITASLFMFHIAIVPLIFRFSSRFRHSIIFANFVQWPFHVDFEEPSKSGIYGARNLSIEYQSKVDKCKVKIGIWHILPRSSYEELKGYFEDNTDKESLNTVLDAQLATSDKPVILYCHGNSNSRATTHRLELYKFFQQMDYHTIAFDYRGYGDSTNIYPTENGVVEDSLMVYEWLLTVVGGKNTTKKPPIFIWGHSLGTGISSHMLGRLEDLSRDVLERSVSLSLPDGLILEAPFNNLADEVASYPLSLLIQWLPYFDRMIIAPFRSSPDHTFRSDMFLPRRPSLPILILHAKDDLVVPFTVGLKLYRAVLESRSESCAPVKLHSYERTEHLGHKWICRAKDLSQVVGDFVRSHQ